MNQVQAVVCPHCRGQVQGDPQLSGMEVACPHCNRPFRMPIAQGTIVGPGVEEALVEPAEEPFRINTAVAEVEARCTECGEWNVFPSTASGGIGECCNCGQPVLIPTSKQASYKRRKAERSYGWLILIAGSALAGWFLTGELHVAVFVLMVASLIFAAIMIVRAAVS